MKRRDVLKSILLAGTTGVLANNSSFASTSTRQQVLRFAHMTDVHVSPKRSSAQGLAKAIRHVHSLKKQPDFILNGGDAIDDGLAESLTATEKQWELWNTAWKAEGSIPLRHCLGNHDIWGWDQSKSKTTGKETLWGKQLALSHYQLDQSYYHFEQAGWKFLVLDSMTPNKETVYQAQLDPTQFEWLREQLKTTPETTPIVLISHIPILTVGTLGFTQELRKYPQGQKMLSHMDAWEIVKLLNQHSNVKLCLSGHTHQTETIRYGDLTFVNSGAVSAYWWKGDFQHTDEGYNLIDLYDDGSFETNYVSYGWEVPK